MKIKDLLKKENENRLIILIGLVIIILIVVGWGINNLMINSAIAEREREIKNSKIINACQKGCNQIVAQLGLNNSDVFSCLEYCNRYYRDKE